jgi:bacteriocin-like protein
MNAHARAGMRELTAEELDQVTGGLAANSPEVEWVLIGVTLGTLFITGVTALWDWLFG